MTVHFQNKENISPRNTDVVKANVESSPTKKKVRNLVTNNVLREINVNRRLPFGDGETYFDKEESAEYIKKIDSSEVAIHFKRKHLGHILKNGYSHWSQLKETENTKQIDLFIPRLAAEFSLFDVNNCNQNILSQAESLIQANRQAFVDKWNECFQKDFSDDITAKELFEQTGYVFVSDEQYYGPVYGCLVDENQEMIGDKDLQETIKQEAEKKGASYYGKSQILIDKEKHSERITYCLGDTFDAQIENYAWKTEKNGAVTDGKMVVFGLEDKENVSRRLQSCTKDSLSYVEAHMHFKVTPNNISKIIIDPAESSGSEEELLAAMYSVNIQKK